MEKVPVIHSRVSRLPHEEVTSNIDRRGTVGLEVDIAGAPEQTTASWDIKNWVNPVNFLRPACGGPRP